MVVMDREPMVSTKLAESILQIFAVRASAELGRKRAEEALKESFAQLSKKNRYEMIISTVTRSVHQSINLQDVLENMERLVVLSAVPIRDDVGKIKGVVFVFREVIEHKRVGTEFLKPQKLESRMTNEFKNAHVRLMILTPSSVVRQGVRKMLESEKYIEIIAEISNYQDILPIVEQNKPDLLFVDKTLPTLKILEILSSVRDKSPTTKVLLLLHSFDEDFIMDALSLGVRGYLTDRSNADQFIQAARALSKDEIWGEVEIITKLLTRFLHSKKGSSVVPRPHLTKREDEVVKLIIQGYSNKQVSEKLFISEKTVKSHLNNVYKKLRLSNRLQLVADFLG